MTNNCITCGNEIPEGRQICTGCERKAYADMEADLKAAHEEIGWLRARLDKLNGAIANIPKERLEEICKLYDLFINKKCYKYFAISNTENGKEIDEVIFKDIKIDGERTCIIGYPENGCHGYWHTLKDMGIKCFVGENAKEQAEARLKELKGE